MSEVTAFLERLGISDDEAMNALITAVCPMAPPTLRQNWQRSDTTGHSAPPNAVVWDKYEDAGFKCTQCSSFHRITLDHVDNDPTNHEPDNLSVLCFSCNRARSKKGTKDTNHKLRITRAIIELYDESGTFPKNSDILAKADVKQIGGATYWVKFLKAQLKEKRALEKEEKKRARRPNFDLLAMGLKVGDRLYPNDPVCEPIEIVDNKRVKDADGEVGFLSPMTKRLQGLENITTPLMYWKDEKGVLLKTRYENCQDDSGSH